jgi:hypothetical protein
MHARNRVLPVRAPWPAAGCEFDRAARRGHGLRELPAYSR